MLVCLWMVQLSRKHRCSYAIVIKLQLFLHRKWATNWVPEASKMQPLPLQSRSRDGMGQGSHCEHMAQSLRGSHGADPWTPSVQEL